MQASLDATALQTALELWDIGFNVIPMQPGSRKPFTAWKKPYLNNRPNKLEVQQLFGKHKTGMPGVILDAQSRIIMLEGDAPGSDDALRRFKLAPTLTVQSRRGKHYFYRWPAGRPYPQTSGFYLVEKGSNDEVEFKANSLTAMPPQVHHADPSFVLSFCDGPFTIAEVSAEVIASTERHEAAQRAAYEANAAEARAAWANVLIDLVDGGWLDDLVRFAGPWRSNGTRGLYCPMADEHREHEQNRPSAYIITHDGAGMRCDKETHALSVLDFLVRVGFGKDARAVKKQLAKLGISFPSNYTANGKPELDATDGDLDRVTVASINALRQTNEPVRLMLRNNALVRVERDERGEVIVHTLDADGVRCELAARIAWYSVKEGERRAARPPREFAVNLLKKGELGFPPLRGITEVPTFRPDGSLHDTPGYDAVTGMYYQPAPGLVMPTVPEKPTDAQVSAARALILDDLLADFPFVGEADKAHALALALLPFARGLIDGPTPMHVIDAPVQGSGKGKLARLLLTIGRTDHPRSTSWVSSEEEVEKRLMSFLQDGASAVIFDNVEGVMRSVSLCLALTEPVYVGRVLGKSYTPKFDVRTIWALTSNNATLHKDLLRRSIQCRIDPKTDKPFQREHFKHPQIEAWAREHRGELLAAALTIIRAWIVRGRPAPTGVKPLGSYELWTRIMGGILQVAQVPGFLANLAEFHSSADIEEAPWIDFMAQWFGQYGAKPVQTRDVLGLADACGLVFPNGSPLQQATTLGKKFHYRQDRIVGGYRIVRDTGSTGGTARYFCERVGAAPAPEVGTDAF